MRIVLIAICILLAVFALILLTQTGHRSFTMEAAKGMCSGYCKMACKLNSSQNDMEKIWNIEIFIENAGNKKCGELVGNCLCS